MREGLKRFHGLVSECQGQNLVLTVLDVPYLLVSRGALIPGYLLRAKWTAVQGYLAHEKTPTPLGPP